MENSILDLSALRFPVIAFSNDRAMYFGRKRDDIEICTNTGLKNGFFNGLRVVDADGADYWIIEAVKIGTVGPLWGYNVFLNQKLRVQLYLGEMGDVVSLESLKMHISKILNSNKAYWDSDGLIKERIDFINTATSHFEIINKLTDDFYLKDR